MDETPQAQLHASQFQALLDALDSPFTKTPQHARAAADLRNLGTNAMPLLLSQVKLLDTLKGTNSASALNQQTKLQAAFDVLGPQAKSLLPELVAEFKSGRNLGITAYALGRIGGAEAGHALVQAITNSSPQMRASGASSIEYFKGDPEVAASAVQPLLQLMTDRSGPLRSLAAAALGKLKTNPDTVIPALLRTLDTDPDAIVRATAAESIGRFGSDATPAAERLGRAAKSDGDEHVRTMAAQAIKELYKGSPSPQPADGVVH
jgi:hypothetical protein